MAATTVNNLVDWTVDPSTGRFNSSEGFRFLTRKIAELLRNNSREIAECRFERVATLILAQLTHVHGLTPKDFLVQKPGERGDNLNLNPLREELERLLMLLKDRQSGLFS